MGPILSDSQLVSQKLYGVVKECGRFKLMEYLFKTIDVNKQYDRGE